MDESTVRQPIGDCYLMELSGSEKGNLDPPGAQDPSGIQETVVSGEENRFVVKSPDSAMSIFMGGQRHRSSCRDSC
jgi:hypothetical protein